MNEIELSGCAPMPLAGYLKGIGVLRLLSRRDPQCRAAWRAEHLVLYTQLTREAAADYLLREYAPTAILAPWSGGSGFYEKDNKSALDAIVRGHDPRLSNYRGALAAAETALVGLDRNASPKGEIKQALLTRLRGALPDHALDWFDAAVVLAGDSPKYPPLLGTGGNDGRLDFSNNFMQRVVDVMDPDTGEPTPGAARWLDMALFGDLAPALVKNAIGQFSPGQVGGPNFTTGFGDKGRINPWDFILLLEGALGFASAVVRRNAEDGEGVLSYPFTVQATSAGAGNLGPGDADPAAAHGELWMPLWGRFASYAEIRALLSEGRVALGRRPARDALDFVRAVHRLGGYRGVDRFQRYGLLMRSGKAFLATPLQRVVVRPNPQSEWIDELEQGDWLARFRRFARGNKVARRFIVLRKRLEDALFEFAGIAASPVQVQALLALLGEIQYALAGSAGARKEFGPVPLLSARWALGADDGSPAYRIARALASLRGEEGKPLPLRAQLFPVHPRRHGWIEAACKAKGAGKDPGCTLRLTVPRGGRLTDTLTALLERRLWLAARLEFRDKPFSAEVGLGLDDLDAFVRDARLDRAIAALLPGMVLCKAVQASDKSAGGAAAPAAFGLLKLVLTPDAQLRSLAGLPADRRVPVPPGLVAQLASGHSGQARRAVEAAWRRLRGSGLAPLMPRTQCPELAGADPRRLAAALLIPLSYGATGMLLACCSHSQKPLPSRSDLHLRSFHRSR